MSSIDEGKRFESNWADSYKNTGYYYQKLKDSNKWSNSSKTRFSPKNPYDSFQYSFPFFFTLELKSTKGTGISFIPKIPYDTTNKASVMIKPHQVKGLMDSVHSDGVIGGLILNYRERSTKTKSEGNQVFFVHINDFIKFAETCDKSSISREDCKRFGIEISWTKKKVNYVYNIEKFYRDTVMSYLNSNDDTSVLQNKLKKWNEYIEELNRKEVYNH